MIEKYEYKMKIYLLKVFLTFFILLTTYQAGGNIILRILPNFYIFSLFCKAFEIKIISFIAYIIFIYSATFTY